MSCISTLCTGRSWKEYWGGKRLIEGLFVNFLTSSRYCRDTALNGLSFQQILCFSFDIIIDMGYSVVASSDKLETKISEQYFVQNFFKSLSIVFSEDGSHILLKTTVCFQNSAVCWYSLQRYIGLSNRWSSKYCGVWNFIHISKLFRNLCGKWARSDLYSVIPSLFPS
jgi:hypothetical protein